MSEQTIFFDTIPSGIRRPGQYFEYNNKLALKGLPANAPKVCIIGQKTSSGSIAQAIPTKAFSEADAILYSGRGSMVHRMVKAALTANPNIDLTIVNLDDAAGTPASGTVTFTGPATGAGVMVYKCGKDHVEVTVPSGMTADQAAAALVTGIAARPELPITSAAGADPNEHVVTATAKNDGTVGNQILHSIEITAPGLTAVVVAMASGATDPDIDTALASIAGVRFHFIVSPYNNLTNLTTLMTYSGSPVAKLKAHLEAMDAPRVQRRGFGIFAQTGALALTTTLAGNANYQRLHFPYIRGVKMWPPELAAAQAATWALRSDPALPLNSMEVKGVDVPAISSRFSSNEIDTLLAGGVTPLEVGAGEVVRIVRAISTYTLNASSTPDASYLDVTTITALDYGDQAIRERIALRFTPAKGTERTMRNLRSEILATMYLLQALEIWHRIDEYKDALLIEGDLQDPTTWRTSIPAPVVPGFHVLAGQLVLHLG